MKRMTALVYLVALPAFGQGTTQSIVPVGFNSNQNGNSGDSILVGGDNSYLFTPAALPSEWTTPVFVMGIAFRLNEDPGFFPVTSVLSQVIISSSTTSTTPATMVRRYSSMAGPDNITVFSHNNVALSATTGTGPNPFALVFNFDKPFLYDPHAGNLLLNMQVLGGFSGGQFVIDAEFSNGAPYGTSGDPFPNGTRRIPVTQISWTAVPEMRVEILAGFGFALLYLFARRGKEKNATF